MRFALCQAPSPQGDIALALHQTKAALCAAAAMGAQALVLPEVWLPGYNQPDIAARAVPLDGALIRDVAGMCAQAGCALVMGFAERAGDDVFNAAVVIGADGAVLGNYRKVQLYGPREKAIYTPGQDYLIFDLGGIRAAVLICYDIEFAPHIAALAARGVQVILTPTANMQPFTHVVRHTVPAMAANHGLTIVYANFCGTEGDLTYVGGSLIAGPHGAVLAQAGEGPALLIADVPAIDPARIATQSFDYRKI